MKTKIWTEPLGDSESEARYKIDVEKGHLAGVRVIGYYMDDLGECHEFVRWDDSHGQFHKHCLYEKRQRRIDIHLPLETAFNGARAELRSDWKDYKKEFVRNHVQNG